MKSGTDRAHLWIISIVLCTKLGSGTRLGSETTGWEDGENLIRPGSADGAPDPSCGVLLYPRCYCRAFMNSRVYLAMCAHIHHRLHPSFDTTTATYTL
ncbi:hypothetical protein F5Y04DRAFT_257582 [Hypomontagnella monticulosa]|nr:hypothetical protein F5Y04DRAFT_257582 [Hypomontagnella monticulosa]